MKKVFLSFVLLLIGIQVFSQDYHSPAEILKLLSDSKIKYGIDILKDEIPYPDYSNKLNVNNIYIRDSSGVLILRKYELWTIAQTAFDEAEKYFSEGKPAEARKKYLEVIAVHPDNAHIITYIGQTYESENDYISAEKYYKLAIEKNRLNFMAHWFLADIYYRKQDYKNAAYEITYAQILNRNNPRIKSAFNDIYKKAKLKNENWNFNPQYKLESEDSSEVKIVSNDIWLGYAMCKALWSYEPNYSEKMGVAKNKLSYTEEKECIIGLLTVLDKNRKASKRPEFKALNTAIKLKMLDEFILYEVFLPKYPQISYKFSEIQTQRMIDYVLTIRGKQKSEKRN